MTEALDGIAGDGAVAIKQRILSYRTPLCHRPFGHRCDGPGGGGDTPEYIHLKMIATTR